MDPSKLNLSRDKSITIPRALFATTPDTFETDIKKLEALYSAKDIVKYLKLTTENISNTLCLSVSKSYNKTISSFITLICEGSYLLQNVKNLFDVEVYQGISLLSIKDIGLFKLISTSNRSTRKDIYNLT